MVLTAGSDSESSLTGATALSTVGTRTGTPGTPDEVAGALRWLADRQEQTEARLAARHLPQDTGLPLYDLRVSALGISDLLSDSRALPLAVQRHERSARDPAAVPAAVDRLQARFGLRSLIVTCDPTAARAADLTQLWRTSGWLASLRPGAELSMAAGEQRLEFRREEGSGQALRAGGAALQRGRSRALLSYLDATDPELRIAPPHGPAAGALTAAMLATYVAWHLREAWAELLLEDHSDANGLPLGSLESILAVLATPEGTAGGGEDLVDLGSERAALQARALALITERVRPEPWRE